MTCPSTESVSWSKKQRPRTPRSRCLPRVLTSSAQRAPPSLGVQTQRAAGCGASAPAPARMEVAWSGASVLPCRCAARRALLAAAPRRVRRAACAAAAEVSAPEGAARGRRRRGTGEASDSADGTAGAAVGTAEAPQRAARVYTSRGGGGGAGARQRPPARGDTPQASPQASPRPAPQRRPQPPRTDAQRAAFAAAIVRDIEGLPPVRPSRAACIHTRRLTQCAAW